MRIGNWHFEFYNVRQHRPMLSGIDHFATGDRVCRPFADADIQAILMMISNRMKNVVWQSKPEFEVTRLLFEFLHKNTLSLLMRFFYDGYVMVDVSDPWHIEFYGEDEYRRRVNDGYDCERYVVKLLDEVFRTTGRTRAEVLRPHIDMLNTINDSDLNLIMNYGAMGILSPENSPRTDGYLDDEQIKEIQADYRKKYGIRFGKWALLITRTPVKFQKIDLPIKELELNEKRKNSIAELLQYMNIPKELHAMFDSAKYANRNEAELDMYGNCVTSWAWVFTRLAERCYEKIRRKDTKVGYPAFIDMWFDIVGVPALQEAQWNEKAKAREELQMWLEMKSAVPEKADIINERIDNLIDNM